ncbi:dienelactone hydrolase family protein [Dactylosporangium sp. NPDC048998]|uniref:dienelactone hydrolase family protein n=1 Tax=Dactylosporangium sp. NPDC048998 TaxID=3363976 RepID=UPI003712E753
MAHVALFHSVYGLRSVERRAANRLRAAGHHVVAPDLYAGRTGATIEEGFALKDRIGWDAITQRARRAVRDLPAGAVLAGFSMGAGVVQALLPDRPDAAGVLLLHGLAAIPAAAALDLPVELHVADPDPFAPPEHVAAWHSAATAAGADVRVFTYPGAAHFYTDADLPDHDARAAALTWRRALDFLATC